ncbi:MAG: right-handed parallel beta-helix repeat-containing protein [Planctomycetota bacterium]|jgi:hypothetical protein
MRTCIVLITLFSIAALGNSATLLVPQNYPLIQQAINAAAPGDTVLVDAGTYNEYIDFVGKSITVKSVHGPVLTVIDANDAWCVATFVNGEGLDSVLEGFTLRNGRGGGSPNYIGGGITCKYSSPTIRDNLIRNNFAGYLGSPYGDGGAIYCDAASPHILDNTIVLNEASYNCGGIYMRDYSSPVIKNNVISWNIGYVAGAIYCQYNSSPLIEDNVIHENIATNGCEGWGAGIFCYYYSNPVIRKNVITDNLGHKPGAGIACRDWSNALIEYNVIQGNISTRSGGGILVETASAPTIRYNLIADNTCDKYGGGMLIDGCSPAVTGNLFINNWSTGIYGGYGGGILLIGGASPNITNNTFYGNIADQQGGAICSMGANATIRNTVCWGNSAPLGAEMALVSSATCSIDSSDVQGGQAGAYIEAGCILQWGQNMIVTDPLFVDPAGEDFHIRYNSPCRNTGDNGAPGMEPLDFEGDPRPAYGITDMGADEFHPHLYYTGNAKPGGAVVAKFIGLPGANPVGLWFGVDVLEPPLPSVFGNWYLAPPYIGPVLLPPVPSSGVLVLPATVPLLPPAPYSAPMQAFIQDRLTNLCVLEVE